MKRVFGKLEAVFDGCYLVFALLLGILLLATASANPARQAAGVMALVLAGGDAFHLVPRIRVILTRQEERFRAALGRGKQITSVTMTVFYLLLWRIGALLAAPPRGWTYLAWVLAAVRIALCLLPQNRWQERCPPVRWGVWRNIPFFLLGALTAGRFFQMQSAVPGLRWMWLAVAVSFACYLPVVLWSNRNPKIGMLMLPKTCAYVWMLAMCLAL